MGSLLRGVLSGISFRAFETAAPLTLGIFSKGIQSIFLSHGAETALERMVLWFGYC